MGNVTLEPEGNEPASSTVGTSQVTIPNNVIVADLNALAAQIDSAIAAASGIQAFANLVQPIHYELSALSQQATPPQTSSSASDLQWWEQGINGAYETLQQIGETLGFVTSKPAPQPQIPPLEILYAQASEIDGHLQASTGTQGFNGVALAVYESLKALELSIPDPVQPSASDLSPSDQGESGDGTAANHYPYTWTPGAPQ